MDGIPGDLQSKYQKLATEYSKIRAQIPVLKKAVLDEQNRNAELRNTLKEKEQSLRKTDQEMDSLIFRNQQLTKRITVLQDELETVSKVKKGKGKFVDSIPDSNNDVMGEEFHKTITENAKLLSLLQEQEENHRQDIDHHIQRIEYLEHELQQREDQHKKAIAKLESEKTSLPASVVYPEPSTDVRIESLQKSNAELAARTRELSDQRLALTTQLEDATRIIRTHLPFVDSSDRELNELNIPYHNRGLQTHALQTVRLAGSYVEQLAGALENLHSRVRQRLIALQVSLSPLNLKFLEHLQDSGRQLHKLKQGYSNFQQSLESESWTIDTTSSFLAISGPLTSYSSYLQKLHSYYLLSMEEECVLLGASETLYALSRDVVNQNRHVAMQITKIASYVKLLAGQNRRQSQHPVESQKRFLKELTAALESLHVALQDLLYSYTKKFLLQRQCKDDIPEQVQVEEDSILNALTSAVTASGKLADALECSGIHSQKSQSNKQSHPIVNAFQKRAAQYLAVLDQEEMPSIPYEEALQNRMEVRGGKEKCKTLMAQISCAQEQTAQAEREREHWQQEYHALLLHQEQKETNVSNPTPSSNNTTTHSEGCEGDGGKTVITHLLGKFSTPFMPQPEVEAREQKLKEYYRARLDELVSRSHTSDSKATAFQSECAVLKARLEDAVQSQKSSEDHAMKLNDELASVTQVYDSQLAVMSEHLANMNEKLVIQKDTIDHLQFQQQQQKTSKKGKQK